MGPLAKWLARAKKPPAAADDSLGAIMRDVPDELMSMLRGLQSRHPAPSSVGAKELLALLGAGGGGFAAGRLSKGES